MVEKMVNDVEEHYFGFLSTVVGDEKLTSREDLIGLLFFYVQSDEDTFLKVDEVSKTEALVSKKSPKDRLKVVIDLAYILLYEFKKLIYSLLLKVKKQKLIEVIIISEFF